MVEFEDHADKMCQIANLAAGSSTDAKRKLVTLHMLVTLHNSFPVAHSIVDWWHLCSTKVALKYKGFYGDFSSMHQSFVTTASTYGEGWGIARLMCRAITFRVSSQCRENDRVLTLGSLPQEIFYCKGRGKEQSLTSSLPPGSGAHSRALKLKSHNPRPGGAVVTNDWCTTSIEAFRPSSVCTCEVVSY